MEKNFLWKMLAVGTLCGAMFCMCPNTISTNQNVYAEMYVNKLLGANTEVKIENSALHKRICELLGKDTNSRLYSKDFINSDDYKEIKTTDSETGIEKITAKKTWLDLSNSGITNILELCQFEFPSTLVAIDLSGNNISNTDIENLNTFVSSDSSTPIIIGETTLEPQSDFKNIIKKINLSFNNIDLSSLSAENLSNATYLFGVQNLEITNNSLVLKNELSNAKYYIRSEDDLYLSYNFYYNDTRYTYTQNSISNLNEKPCGDFKIEIANPPLSESGYFYGLNHTISFTMFDIRIKDSFSVERKQLFSINVDVKNPTTLDIEIDGLDLSKTSIELPPKTSTAIAGTSYTTLKVNYGTLSKSVSLPFKVIDTIKPEIKLKGYPTVYWRQNREWIDPGYTGLDSDDDITELVSVNNGTLDVTQCGTYTITYNLTDKSGLSATEVIRKVVVQEKVFDSINVTSSKTKYSVGDEVILTVQPADLAPIEKYKNFEYSWYINGELFMTSTGDSATGKSAITLVIENKSDIKINVILHAKQTEDDSDIYIDSSDFLITTELNLSSDKTIVIALTITVATILIVISLIYIFKAKKSKQKITSKNKKNKKDQATSNKPDIQVVKDYRGNVDSKTEKENNDKT